MSCACTIFVYIHQVLQDGQDNDKITMISTVVVITSLYSIASHIKTSSDFINTMTCQQYVFNCWAGNYTLLSTITPDTSLLLDN